MPFAQPQQPTLPARHIPRSPSDSLQDSDLSEPSSSYEGKKRSLPWLQISFTSKPISNNSKQRNISGLDNVLDHSSESEFVIVDRVPKSRQERVDDSIPQICGAIRSIVVQEKPRSKLVVSFLAFRGDESEDVFDLIDNFRGAATLNGWSSEDFAICLYLKGHELVLFFLYINAFFFHINYIYT